MQISNTAIEQYINCPRQYHLERHEKKRRSPSQSMMMGRVVHRTIDKTLRSHKEGGEEGYLDIQVASAIFADEWSIEPGLSDKALFTQGLQQIHNLIEGLGSVSAERILKTEHWFSIILEEDLEVVGVIDLVVGGEEFNEETGEVFTAIEVVDWKTTRLFTSPSDANDSLQLSLYILAAKEIWPVASRITGSLHMLESGSHLQTRRSEKDLEEDILFIKSIAKQIAKDEKWAPKLNAQCIHCHLREDCSAYTDALYGPMPKIVEDPSNLDDLADEREAVSLRAKIAKGRQEEIDDIFKAHMAGTGEPLDLDDHFFKISQVQRASYPAIDTCDILVHRLGLEMSDVVAGICDVSKTKLDDLLKRYDGPEDARMVHAALANIAEMSYSSRLYHKKKKPNKKGKK